MNKDIETANGSCHCGSVRFTVQLTNGLHGAVRCNCSLCRMRGAVVVFAQLGGIEITAGADSLGTYQFNTNVAKHHFCLNCGIYTHHQRRFDPNQYAVNTACLDGLSPFDFAEVPVVDGTNHPSDHGGGAMHVTGRLRYQQVE